MSIFPPIKFHLHEFVERGDEETATQKVIIFYSSDIKDTEYDWDSFYQIFWDEVNFDGYLAKILYETAKIDSVEYNIWLNDEHGDALAGGQILELTIANFPTGQIEPFLQYLQEVIEESLVVRTLAPEPVELPVQCTFEREFCSDIGFAVREYAKVRELASEHAERFWRDRTVERRLARKNPVNV